jgi:hypothetical protein
LDFDDEWSDDDEPVQKPKTNTSNQDTSRVKQLESELEKARADVKRLQTLVQGMTNDGSDSEVEGSGERVILGPGVVSGARGKGKGKAVRDDDTHYFDSYEHNGEFHR